MSLAGGDAGVLRIEGMGYLDPGIVTLHGRDPSGACTQLIQRVSQLTVMLGALPKEPERKTARRIGFRRGEELDKS